MRWAMDVAQMSEKRNAYRILVGKPEGKRPLGRPRHRWLDNITMDHSSEWLHNWQLLKKGSAPSVSK
jgi:hypothetical protein